MDDDAADNALPDKAHPDSDHVDKIGIAHGDTGILTLIAHVGDALNRSSYPAPQINEVITEIGEAYGRHIATEVFPTYVIALDEESGQVETKNTGGALRFDQIADAEALIHRLRSAALPVEEALAQLTAITESRPPLNPAIRIVGYLMMALGFALCFQMSFAASAAAVVVSLPIAAILLWSANKGTITTLLPFLLTFLSGLAITLWAVHGGLEDPVRLAVIPVVLLIPGATLTTALIELTTADMIAGATRLIYALVVLLSMAFGLALAIDIVGLSSSDLQDLTTNQAPSWVLWLAGPIFGIGNVLYFCTPKRLWLWIVAFCFGAFWLNEVLQAKIGAAFAGGIALGVALLVAWLVNAYVKGNPSVIVMFLPTFWLLVPGSLGFVAISGAITKDHQLSSLGTNAALSLLSMAICMMLASIIAPLLIRRKSPKTSPRRMHPHVKR